MRTDEQREKRTKADSGIDNRACSEARAGIVSLTVHGELQIDQARVSML